MRFYQLVLSLTLPLFTLVSCSTQRPGDFVKVSEYCPGVRTDIKYATPDNFTGEIVYASADCYVRRFVADRLNRVQAELNKKGYGLMIWDGYRPQRVQYRFWELVPDPQYVADPDKGSRHNRGCAVDLTLVDLNGNAVPMPTEYDDFSRKAHHDFDELTDTLLKNRALLKETMLNNGFTIFPSEWWHYDAVGWENYPIIDVPFDSLQYVRP